MINNHRQLHQHHTRSREGHRYLICEQLTGISGPNNDEQLTSISAAHYVETKFSMPACYYGDSLPEDLTEQPRRSLTSYTIYKRNKEEYCMKTGHHVVTPGNLDQWKTTTRANRKAHLWEIGLGAGRLSYTWRFSLAWSQRTPLLKTVNYCKSEKIPP